MLTVLIVIQQGPNNRPTFVSNSTDVFRTRPFGTKRVFYDWKTKSCCCFLVYIIDPNVKNILKKIHVSRYCFFSTAARDETCVQSTLSRHWPFVLWVDWINTQFSPMADGQSGGHRVEGRNWEEESLLI